jgi:hypothetical protein
MLSIAAVRGIQTVAVAPRGALSLPRSRPVPGNYTLVDHGLARAKGILIGVLR